MPTTQKREERFVRLPPDLYAQLVDMAEHEVGDDEAEGKVSCVPGVDRKPTSHLLKMQF